MYLAYAVLFAAALALSTAFTSLMIRVAVKIGFVDKPGARKIHTRPVALGGGIAIIAAVFVVTATVVAAALFFSDHPSIKWFGEKAAGYLAGVSAILWRLAVIAIGAAALAIMGIVDDRKALGAWPKLLVQIGVAVWLVFNGIQITLFMPWPILGAIATVVWMVFVTNAFNLLDNMDGLSAGVALIISAVFFAVAIETGQIFFAAALAIFAGAVLGYLIYNFPPARIFMGDTGSLFLGYVLGVCAVMFTFVPKDGSLPESAQLLPFVLPFILFAVPFYDTISVIFIRLSEGRHPFDADKRHFSHRLNDLGLDKREAVLTIYAATVATSFPALYLYELSAYASVGAVVQAVMVLFVIAIMEHAGARKKK
jgi:UDP-GlcNAc:undecaprenyl-phosphate/decaprenyl-phosphate GlcNAc-1-phosphate transferase